MRVPRCASSNKDRTKWTWYQCPASTDVPAPLYSLRCWFICQRLLWFLLTGSLYSYCCWFIRQWLLWLILTWQGAKPRTPINNLINDLIKWFYFFTVACYRTQFLTDLFKDPCLSSVIPMVTPTRCHRANGGNPCVGDCGQSWLPNSHILT